MFKTGCWRTRECGRGSKPAPHFSVFGDASRMAKDVDVSMQKSPRPSEVRAQPRRRLRGQTEIRQNAISATFY